MKFNVSGIWKKNTFSVRKNRFWLLLGWAILFLYLKYGNRKRINKVKSIFVRFCQSKKKYISNETIIKDWFAKQFQLMTLLQWSSKLHLSVVLLI